MFLPLGEIGAVEAKNKLGQLLDLLEQNEEITITRHGTEATRLVPLRPVRNRDQVRAALRCRRERAHHFDWDEWESYRDDVRP
jgi:prevent-host-death family protein